MAPENNGEKKLPVGGTNNFDRPNRQTLAVKKTQNDDLPGLRDTIGNGGGDDRDEEPGLRQPDPTRDGSRCDCKRHRWTLGWVHSGEYNNPGFSFPSGHFFNGYGAPFSSPRVEF